MEKGNLIENKDIYELYKQLLYVYTNVIGGGKRVLEPKIEFLIKKGLSREEAIHKLAVKERIIDQDRETENL